LKAKWLTLRRPRLSTSAGGISKKKKIEERERERDGKRR
jgi:hypothetical protein